MVGKIGIFIAEDHKLVREAWKLTLENNSNCEVIGETELCSEALEFCLKNKPDVIIMDINLKDGKSIDVIKEMLDKIPNASIVVVSMINIYSIIKDLYKHGIRAFLTKNSSKEELIEAVLKAAKKESYFSPEVSKVIMQQENEIIHTLNNREIKIIQLISKGMSNKEIGAEMKMSEKTIEGHKTKIYKKLNVGNNIGVYDFAQKNGLVD